MRANTNLIFGSYSAYYRAGADVSKQTIHPQGKVYRLGEKSYTLLMASRTAKRHQRRGIDRRQLAKRLFRVIWEQHFKLQWNQETQQAISFLFNRRGFSFITESYNKDYLEQFPRDAFHILPTEIQNTIATLTDTDHENIDLNGVLTQCSQDPEVLKELRSYILKKYSEYKLLNLCRAIDTQTQNSKTPRDFSEEEYDTLEEDYFATYKDSLKNDPFDYTDKEGNLKKGRYFYQDKYNLRTFIENNGIAPSLLKKLPQVSDHWDFKMSEFKLENEKITDKLEKEDVKTHLHHFAFAIDQIHQEIQSGGRHRSRYFEELRDVLESKEHKPGYLNNFCTQLQENQLKPLNIQNLSNLIGHISNLELKPLRKYFNDAKHKYDPKSKTSDYWSEQLFAQYFTNWVLNEWRVNPAKDKLKGKDAKYSYPKLCESIKDKVGTTQEVKDHQEKGSIIDFLLKEDPNQTIPPYQDNNNRRPPKCQSLLLNPVYLDKAYPEWKDWLEQLKKLEIIKTHLGQEDDNYRDQLKKLKTSKNNSYFSQLDPAKGSKKVKSNRRETRHLDARELQFILDRSSGYKKHDSQYQDPLPLNHIYGLVKKIKQLKRDGKADHQSTQDSQQEVEKIIQDNTFPSSLKHEPNWKASSVFPQGSFLHFVCKYYKTRQRARDGRLFIFPEERQTYQRGYEKTGRYDDADQLMTYCNLKPRQKRYQLINDFAALLQIKPSSLIEKLKKLIEKSEVDTEKPIDEEKLIKQIEKCLDNLRNFTKKSVADCAKAQKDRKGRLEMDIRRIYALIQIRRAPNHSDTPLQEKEVKEILKVSRVEKPLDLYKLCKKAKTSYLELIHYFVPEKHAEQELECNRNPAKAVFLLAQLESILFKDRNGNAKTCPICSMDNALRMQDSAQQDHPAGSHKKAQRLPAIPTRLIDGAIMRMSGIVGSAIARDVWDKIEKDLRDGKKVHLPLITESNRFEFEPSKETLVKNQRQNPRKGKTIEAKDIEKAEVDYQEEYNDKEERIKQASKYCPYTGKTLNREGEIDHIIPRSSDYGTLNDEANLIYASKQGNNQKGNQEYRLSNLSKNYKNEIFEGKSDQQIQEWIIKQIGNGEDEFTFGTYHNFDNLEKDQKIAFRHALFLVGHPLREKVIRTIDNRRRALVNGTQRYFAETLANAIRRLAKKAGILPKQLSFDYFGVEAWSSNRGTGIKDIRTAYEKDEKSLLKTLLADYRKQQDASQKPHSHEKDEKSLLKPSEKDAKAPQKPHSHVIDASIAFAKVASDHRNQGSLKLNMQDKVQLHPTSNKAHDLLGLIQPDAEKTCVEELKKREAYDVETHHRKYYKKYKKHVTQINYPIHRDSLLGQRFMPLFCIEGVWYKGFTPDKKKCAKITISKKIDFDQFKQDFLRSTKANQIFTIDKTKALDFLMNIDKTADKAKQLTAKLLDKLSYSVIKKPIQNVLTPENGNPTIREAIAKWNNQINEKNFTVDSVLLPIYHEWQKLFQTLQQAPDKEQPLQSFLKQHFLKQNNTKAPHQKVRKVFSLPVKDSIGSVRLRRQSWHGTSIIQLVAEESLARYGIDKKRGDRPHTILSKNSIPKKHYQGLPNNWESQKRNWETIAPQKLPPGYTGEIKHRDAGRCRVRLSAEKLDAELKSIFGDKTWKGTLKKHKDKETLEKALEKAKNNTTKHVLEAKFTELWNKRFPELNSIEPDRGIELQVKSDGITLKFIARTKDWMRDTLLKGLEKIPQSK